MSVRKARAREFVCFPLIGKLTDKIYLLVYLGKYTPHSLAPTGETLTALAGLVYIATGRVAVAMSVILIVYAPGYIDDPMSYHTILPCRKVISQTPHLPTPVFPIVSIFLLI